MIRQYTKKQEQHEIAMQRCHVVESRKNAKYLKAMHVGKPIKPIKRGNRYEQKSPPL